MNTPHHKCNKCEHGFFGEGMTCKYCREGIERPETKKFKGFCHSSNIKHDVDQKGDEHGK